MMKQKKRRTVKHNREEQIIRRKKISLVMQFGGILFAIIGAVCLLLAAGSADYSAEIGYVSNDWFKFIIASVAWFVTGATMIMFPKHVFHMSMF